MTSKTNKTIPMDKWMIEKIHEIMLEHMKDEGKPISFGEAARILLSLGIVNHELKISKNKTKSLIKLYGRNESK